MLAKAPRPACALGPGAQRAAAPALRGAAAPASAQWRAGSATVPSARGRGLAATPSGGPGVEVLLVEEVITPDVTRAADAAMDTAEMAEMKAEVVLAESTLLQVEVERVGPLAAMATEVETEAADVLEQQQQQLGEGPQALREAVPGGVEDVLAAPLAADALEVAVRAAADAAAAPSTNPSPSAAAATASATSAGSAAAAAEVPAYRRAPAVDLPLDALLRNAASSASSGGGAGPRPFPPPLDLPRLQEALLGEPTIGPIFAELFDLSSRRGSAGGGGDAGGAGPGPLLYAPRFPRRPGSPPASALPLLVYLPGIDGTGLAAYRQFPALAARFELRGVFLPPEDRTPFAGLVEQLAEQIEDECAGLDPGRPVYLLGESFGGLLALALAQRLSCVDRLILVNPATSFERSPWPALGPLLPALPPPLYRLLPVALSPLLANPLAMAAHAIASPADPPQQQAVDVLYGLLDLLPELSSLRVVLPPETLSWRLQLLAQGAREVNPTLKRVRQRVLLLGGENDLVIPSASELPRLARALPRAHPRVLPGRSHALLQEAGVDLVGILQEEDFYVSRRRLTRPNAPPPAAPSSSISSPSRPRPAPGGAAFGTPGPLELPTPGELRRSAAEAGLDTLRTLVSPVFLSTDGPTGRVQPGLGALPPPGSGPLLLVGNHQLFAPDMPLLVERFLAERGQLLRGMAHPMALGAGQASPDPESSGRFGRFLETFGAVPVGGRALHSLLGAGEAVLLYPGGVREALKLRDERYELIWPRRPEFVRMACKFGATIVPFAAVGAEDSLELLADRRDLLRTPLLGEWLRRQNEKSVLARRGVSVAAELEESFIPPLVGLKPPSRFYFLFGAPIPTDPRVADDRAAVDALYGAVRGGVEGCLGYLLRKRESDPYRELLPRLAYEAGWGGRRQAPTFKP